MATDLNLVQLIGNLGFPIAVSVYCLVTLNRTIQGLKDTVNNNTVVIQKLLDKIGDGKIG